MTVVTAQVIPGKSQADQTGKRCNHTARRGSYVGGVCLSSSLPKREALLHVLVNTVSIT